MAISAKLQKQLAALPKDAGVYIMRDGDGVVVYVGKATSLKQRVKSYFQSPEKLAPKTAAQMRVVESLEWTVVSSPMEALVLESNLIKEYNPKYNIMLRDDKHYPYLCITLKEKYPRLITVRATKNDGNRYFGPYVSSGAMKMTEKLLRDIFPLRRCSNVTFRSQKRPCLNFHIKKCLAPCTGEVSKVEYDEMVNQVILFLEGKTNKIVNDLTAQMNVAAEEMRFEDAARMRDQIRAVVAVQTRQHMDIGTENRDMIGLAVEGELATVQMFFVREGKVVGREHFFMENLQQKSKSDVMSAFLGQYYSGVDFMPPEICLSTDIEDVATTQNWLGERRGAKVLLNVPKIGDKKRLLDLVDKNAKLILGREIEEQVYKKVAEAEALVELQEICKLPKTPYRIECYDNSHWQGTYTVASMVTFLGGKPAKSLYRHSRVKIDAGGNDLLAMRESLSRRIGWGLTQREQLKNGEIKIAEAPMAEFPDLLVVDGGRQQLAVAMDLIETLELDINAIGLAEMEEWIYLPHSNEPIILPRSNRALQLLMRIRDEAHRFGVTYQRKLREKGQKESALDSIPGIGAVRRTALLKTYGSLEKILEASEDELALVETMNKKVAHELYEYLHKK